MTDNSAETELLALAGEVDAWHDACTQQSDGGNGQFRVVCSSGSDEQARGLRSTLRNVSKALRSTAATVSRDREAIAPTAWLKQLRGAECKPDGRCYDIVFADPNNDSYTPLYADATPIGSGAGEPVAWVIPVSGGCDCNGFISAKAWQDGEFSRPLYAHPITSDAAAKMQEACIEKVSSYLDMGWKGGELIDALRSLPVSQTGIEWDGDARCPTCNLNWTLFPPNKIHESGLVRCVECKGTSAALAALPVPGGQSEPLSPVLVQLVQTKSQNEGVGVALSSNAKSGGAA